MQNLETMTTQELKALTIKEMQNPNYAERVAALKLISAEAIKRAKGRGPVLEKKAKILKGIIAKL
jgi:hypothetical protein